jgi:hypothetical protein
MDDDSRNEICSDVVRQLFYMSENSNYSQEASAALERDYILLQCGQFTFPRWYVDNYLPGLWVTEGWPNPNYR